MKGRVALLLSTYNGADYLDHLLQSILNQSYSDYVIFIRDDGSYDETIKLIRSYTDKYNNIILIDSEDRLGPKFSFIKLLNDVYNAYNFEYFMFVDQDDVWLHDKIEATLNKLKSVEYKDLPILVHTDLVVVDSHLSKISNSFWQYQKLNPNYNQLNRLLVQNVVTGCTMMINRKLAEMCLTIPEEAIMHDWWIALISCSFGLVYHINEPTIFYRQHNTNTVGAKKFNIKNAFNQFFFKFDFLKNIYQAKAFYKHFSNHLNEKDIEILRQFILLENVSYLKKLYIIFKYRFFKNNIIRNIGFLIKIRRL